MQLTQFGSAVSPFEESSNEIQFNFGQMGRLREGRTEKERLDFLNELILDTMLSLMRRNNFFFPYSFCF